MPGFSSSESRFSWLKDLKSRMNDLINEFVIDLSLKSINEKSSDMILMSHDYLLTAPAFGDHDWSQSDCQCHGVWAFVGGNYLAKYLNGDSAGQGKKRQSRCAKILKRNIRNVKRIKRIRLNFSIGLPPMT